MVVYDWTYANNSNCCNESIILSLISFHNFIEAQMLYKLDFLPGVLIDASRAKLTSTAITQLVANRCLYVTDEKNVSKNENEEAYQQAKSLRWSDI